MPNSATHDRPDIRAAASPEPACYTCPGESKPITRAVHFSRLAAYYGACRGCEHRHDTGALPRQIVERIDRVAQRGAPQGPATPFGLRGTYLNQISRVTAQRYAAAFAHVIQDVNDGERQVINHRPTIIIGQDSRYSSPDIAAGVTSALRRRGCQIVDTGITSLPCVRFALNHLQAAGAILVSGYGFGPAYTGLDFLGSRAMPWSSPGRLDALIACADAMPPRNTRCGGRQRSFAADVPYAAGLWKHFHALRRLRIAVCCPVPSLRRLLHDLFEQLPCRLTWVECPLGADMQRVHLESKQALQRAMSAEPHHAGLLIHDDAQTCEFFDEAGRALEIAAIAGPLIRALAAEHARVVCLVDQGMRQECGDAFAACALVEAADKEPERFVRKFDEVAAQIGIDAGGRFWFADSYPVCDAVVTFARFLQILSRSDAPASALRRG